MTSLSMDIFFPFFTGGDILILSGFIFDRLIKKGG